MSGDLTDETVASAILERLDRIERRLDGERPTGEVPTSADVPPPGGPAAARRFTLLDLMILVAVSALVLPVYRPLWAAVEDMDLDAIQNVPTLVVWLVVGLTFVTPVAAGLSIGVVVLRFLRPRPSRRKLSCQAGALGALAAMLVIPTVGTANALVLWAVDGPNDFNDFIFWCLLGWPRIAGMAVFGVWTALVAAGRFRRPVDWVDRLGLLLCVYWLLASPVSLPVY